MHAYEYGIRNFNKKYQPIPNIVVFNDHIVFVDGREAPEEEQFVPNLYPSPYSYRQVKHIEDNKYNYELPNKAVIDGNIMDDYLILNGHITIIEDTIIENVPPYSILDDPTFYTELHDVTIYVYEGKYYVKTQLASLGGEANTGEITSSSPKLFSLYDKKLQELLEDPSLSLIFFFSKDGAKLESAQQEINDVKDNEIIFFLEKDDTYNIFGSVARVLSGKNINSIVKIPYTSAAHLANVFKVNTNPNQIKKVCEGHLEAKKTNEEKEFYYYLGKAVDFVAELTTNFFKVTQGDPLIYVGEAISENIRFDEKRWRYFDEEGKPSKNFSPIIPGFTDFLEITDSIDENIEKNNENFKTKLANIEEYINDFLDKVPIKNIRNYLKKKLVILFDVIEEMRNVYKTIVKVIASKELFLFANALLIGLLNSLAAAVGGILTLIGHIINLPYYLYKASKVNDRKSGYVSMVIELLENGIEAFAALFSAKNLAAIAAFFISAPQVVRDFLTSPSAIMTKTAETGNYVKTHSDAIGYGIGYAVGFVIEEVLTTMATMGTSNVVKAVKVTVDSFKSILISTGKIAKFTITSPATLVKGLSLLFQRIRKLNVPKLLNEFLAFLKSLLTTAKKLAQEAFEKTFSIKSQRRLKKVGMEPTAVDDIGAITFCPIKP